MKKALTLLELVVVMGVIAVISAMSVFGLIRFRSVIELNNGYTDIVSLLKTTQNAARNVTSDGNPNSTNVPDLYSLKFENDKFSKTNCELFGERYTCISTETQTTIAPAINFVTDVNCTFIGFTPLTGEIVSLNSSGNVTDMQECNINIIHSVSGDVKELKVDLLSNTIQNI